MCVYVYTHCMCLLVMAACARERCSLCLAGDGAVGMSGWDSVPCRREMACPWGPWPLRPPASSLCESPARGKGQGPSREVASVGIHGPRGPWRGVFKSRVVSLSQGVLPRPPHHTNVQSHPFKGKSLGCEGWRWERTCVHVGQCWMKTWEDVSVHVCVWG